MESWHILGHGVVKNILEKQIASGKLPHAYLFSGSESVGKKSLALEFSRKVLQTENLDNHPDFQILDAPGEIVMEQVLDFIAKTGYKPFLGSKKIAIINNAQNLNTQSSNALLKTLEEPSDSSIIILIANPGRILPTISSRCQLLSFSIFSTAELKEFAEKAGIKITEQIAAISFGRPGRLKKLSEDKEFFQQEADVVSAYQKLSGGSLGERLASLGGFAEMASPQLEENLLTWMFWQTEELKNKPKDFSKVQAILEAFLALRKNYNKKLVLQGLFMKI